MAFSELGVDGEYANPLRPEGSVLQPYVARTPPEISKPAVSADGQVIVAAYDPQTFVRKTTYVTPVLAPAALAYRLYDGHGDPVTPVEWAFRGTHLLQFAQRSLIYAPGARAPGFACFASRSVCVPHWTYRVADGLAPPLPTTLQNGRYRLTIYAWDWADNTTALDTTVTLTSIGWRPIGRVPAALSRMPGYSERNLLLPPPSAPRSPLAPREYNTPSYAPLLPPNAPAYVPTPAHNPSSEGPSTGPQHPVGRTPAGRSDAAGDSQPSTVRRRIGHASG
jgi:hypothetical protein